MNNQRRKKLEAALTKLAAIQEELTELQEQELTAYNNLPEDVQDSERGEYMEEAADDLGQADDDIQEIIDTLQQYL